MKVKHWFFGELVLFLVFTVGFLCVPAAWSAEFEIAGSSDGLVAHYKFEGNAKDSAGNNDGTEHGGVSYVAGKFGQAASLDAKSHII